MSKKSQNKKKVTLVSIILFVLLLLFTIGLFGIVISLGILPMKYLIILLLVFGLFYIGISKVVFGKKIRIWVKIFIDIICILLISIMLFVYYYLNSTLHFMDKISARNYQIENYYVLANKKSYIDELSDIKNLGIYDTSEKKYKNALKELNKKDFSYEKKLYDSYLNLGNALLNEEIDAIFMSASYKDIVSEMITDFSNNTKVIFVIEIKSKSDIDVNDIDVTEQSFNIYISGIDVFGEINMISRSDVNMIMSVNPKTHDILLTSIPRDYYVRLHDTVGYKDKLTHAGLYGINMSITTIEDLLDIDIDYYARVNFTTLINLVDAIGGIEVYSDIDFTSTTDHHYSFKKGVNILDGKSALAFARERKSYIDGDRHRVKNQQDVLSAIMKKALSSKTLITKYTNILESMGSSFQTNIPTEKIYSLINKQLNSMPNWNFDNYSLNGYDSTNGTYTFGDQQLYVMEPDMSTVEKAQEKIDLIMEKE